MISASLVKELREKTGAGMMDCKKALVATEGDLEKAVVWLRENGILKAQKKAHRIAAEGMCDYVVDGNKAVLFEVNCETDFVMKTKEFQELVQTVGKALLTSGANDVESGLNADTGNGTVRDLLINATATIGENIVLRRVSVLEKTDEQIFGSYNHMNGKIVVVDVLEGGDELVAKDVCMHVAAMNPLYLNRDSINPDDLDKEREILRKETLNEGKPEKIVDRIVEGKIQKYFKTVCLVEQQFVKNPDQTVGDYLKANNGAVLKYVRFEVGEGVEKNNDDNASDN
ncbi:MAG: translation elongation factor Ts [Bacilli bacterium]|jgi:elongation factor Ts|nr:elongation factor Ts [Acholeplasmataceae bacterium]HOA78672.1 translation elongation factor Ts [Bacilli bacterium]HPZ27164.1 translation elongation factor Ts [Bacilli bacterium]HQC88854.1 translation elongation factor Ts [Bacilli bacterium]